MLSIFSLLFSILISVLNPGGHNPLRKPSPAPRVPMTKARAWKSFGALPMSFELNQGQADRAVSFVARGQGYTILLSPAEAALALQSQAPGARSRVQPQPRPSTRVLRMRIEGANPSAPATALERLPGVSNYFIGNDPSQWHTNIPTYKKVQFENIRPGVNLVYYGNQSQLEYDFVLSPGVNPQSLGLSFEGSDAAIDSHGDLVFTSTGGSMTFRCPVAYQTDKSQPAKKHFVAASYVLRGRNKVGFEVPHYDPSEPLVIDPYLSYSTYLGGSGGDTGNAIALDGIFDAYITGSTSSTNFPKAGSPSPYQGSYGGDGDAFVTRLRYDGEALLYSTYLGGNNYDIGQGIGVDSSGNAYVVGSTSSANFPTTASAFQTTYGGNTDAFVSKLDLSGSKLLFSSFLGGSDIDYGLALAVDASGNMFVTGSTQSTDFPTTANPIQAGNAGKGDAFVAEIDTNLPETQQLVYSTYLGGSSADSGQGIAVDSDDNAYVTGFTFSINFPTYQAYQSESAGSVDAFITVISPYGKNLVFSTYLGGTGDDRAWAIALDSQNNIYVAGSSLTACSPANSTTTYCSSISTFPTSPGAFQTSTTKEAPGYPVAFVTEMNHFGTTVVYSTLLGGSLSDVASGIAVDSAGDAYVTGYTESSDFPTANAIQASYTGGTCGSTPCPDAFVTEVNPQGTSLVYSTYLGGSSGNYGNAIAVDTSANAYVAGTTFSQNFPAIALAYQGESGNTTGLSNAFISMISHNNFPGVALTPQKINFGNVTEGTTENVTSENVPAVVTVLNAGTAPLQISGIATTGDFAETNNCVGTLPAGGGVCTINVTYTPTVLAPETEQLAITDSAAGSPHLVTLTGTGVTGVAQVQFSPSSLVFPATIINTTSASQTVTMTNNGETALTVTNITATDGFAETNTCPSYPFTMAVGGSCSFSVTFSPTTTGVIKGSLTVTDNVTSGASSVALTGTGDPNFTLISPTASEFVPIGTTTTTFTVSLTAPQSLNFSDTIALGCSSGSCSFNPANIALNSTTIPTTSTLTLSGLSASSPNPSIFTVNGKDVTSGVETATLSLSVYFGDFSISATPAVSTITSGASTIYSVTVSPVNNFNQAVSISCGKLPQGALCLANPAALTPLNGAAVSSQLTVSTTPQSTSTTPSSLLPRARPRVPPPPPMMLAVWGACNLLIVVILLVRAKRRPRGMGKRRRLIYAQVALAMLALAAAFWISCDTDIYTNVIQPSTVNGTPTGNYTITILGTFTGETAGIGVTGGTQTTVTHTTAVNLVVQ